MYRRLGNDTNVRLPGDPCDPGYVRGLTSTVDLDISNDVDFGFKSSISRAQVALLMILDR
jgi:hypothetical protein